MKLYHGSEVIVKQPQIILVQGRTTDFGSGFYTSTDYEQAVQWIKTKIQDKKLSIGYVSKYEVPDTLLKDSELHNKIFTKANKEWLNFVTKNRNDTEFTHAFDIVFGAVANDRVYVSLALFEGGFIDDKETIKRLKTYKLANQLLFHTEKSLQYLRFIGADKIL